MINLLNSLSVCSSTIICLANRLLYQKNILNNLNLNRSTIKKEKIYSLLIGFSSCCRIACMTLNLVGIDYYKPLRNFDEECIDQSPIHALMILLMTVCINLVPPLIFSIIFCSSYSEKKDGFEEK